MVNVQSETIEKYIREGSIVPDSVVPQSEHRSVKLFKKETVLNYANQFGWISISGLGAILYWFVSRTYRLVYGVG